MVAAQGALEALFAIRLAFPITLLISSISLLTIKPTLTSTSPSPITSVVVAVTTPRRSLILSLLSLVALTYFLDGFALVLHSVLTKTWQGIPQHGPWIAQWSGLEVEVIAGLLASGLLAILGVWKESQGITIWTMSSPKLWAALAVIGTIVEVTLIAATVVITGKQPIGIPEHPRYWTNFPALLHSLFPIFRLFLLVTLYAALAYPRTRFVAVSETRVDGDGLAAAEDSSLLAPAEEGILASRGLSATGANGQAYGTFRTARSLAPTTGSTTRSHTPAPSVNHEAISTVKSSSKTKTQEGTSQAEYTPSWGEMYRRLSKLTPYLWPKGSLWLQFLAALCILILIVGRFVNAATPLTLGALVDLFEKQYGEGNPPQETRSFWPYLLAYIGLRFLQMSGGLGALRDTLWAPVMQYSDREMSKLSFNHLLSLSLSFHLRRKTGEILRILDRGSAINRIFELLLFNILPTFIDIFVALAIFVWKFDWTLAVLIAFVMAGYISTSIALTTWRTRIRRQMNDKDIIARGIHTDCLLNYETVKYFGGEAFENQRYAEAIKDYQALEYRVILSLNLLNLVQNLIMTIGFLVGSIIVALRVTQGSSTPSEFVIFVIYLGQLYGPLNQLGYVYRSINTSLVDTERLMKLLDEPTEVNDKPGAPDLVVDDGEIEFENVSFSYDGRNYALNNVSFKVPKGGSVALVGESGSGKSTILRLLYRFYDLKEGEGRILIDGQDIRDVTQLSLRKSIGVVPQDSVLFNASISYNIGYGKFDASREEIEAAATAAQMHDRILSFPDGYDTKVGERGVRLSGGEKQRVAIARTLLKNPPILLLDEATSALDTSTERDIQKALQNLVQGRSSLSIAHRLSTIASADVILVLKNGQIVEQGSHRELLERDGVFATMWADQIRSEETDLAVPDTKREVSGYSVSSTAKTTEASVPKAGVESDFEPVTQSGAEEGSSIVQGASESRNEEVEGEKTAEGTSNVASEPTTSESVIHHKAPSISSATPVAFPSSDAPVSFPSGPVAFPGSEPEQEAPSGTATPVVTFDDSVPHPTGRNTPDLSDPKRKRTASQNFQRFARRVSLVGRRQGSVVIPGVNAPLKDDKKPRDSAEGSDRGEGSGSVRGEGESPAASVQEGKRIREKLKKRLSLGPGSK